jgi:hypothetical protein
LTKKKVNKLNSLTIVAISCRWGKLHVCIYLLINEPTYFLRDFVQWIFLFHIMLVHQASCKKKQKLFWFFWWADFWVASRLVASQPFLTKQAKQNVHKKLHNKNLQKTDFYQLTYTLLRYVLCLRSFLNSSLL